MDYPGIFEAIERGTATESLPRWALSLMRDIASGGRELTAVRHPLGFLCFPAERQGGHGVCVHFWTPGLRSVLTTSKVHSHSWDLTSYVLYGTLLNQRIRVAPAAGQATHRLFEVRSHGDVDELRATTRLVSYRPEAGRLHGAGSVYILPAGEFHATVIPGEQDVATVVLSRSHPQIADVALGPVHAPDHTLTRSRCDAQETASAAALIAGRLAAVSLAGREIQPDEGGHDEGSHD
jgi:hypothetical protein